MSRPAIVVLVSAGYLVLAFVVYRLRLWRSLRRGLPLELLRRFDDRAVLEPLKASAPGPVACAAEEIARRARAGDRRGARALAESLPAPFPGPLLALIELWHAEQLGAQGRKALAAEAAARADRHAASSRGPAEVRAGLAYLRAHARLCFRTHPLNWELSLALACRLIRRALREHGERPFLLFALAHARALGGRPEEAVDELGRALYHARGDRFYARAVLESPLVARVRPALVAQCRKMIETSGADQGG